MSYDGPHVGPRVEYKTVRVKASSQTTSLHNMGIHTLRCKSGKKVRDVLLDEKATEKAKNPPRGTRRRIKIILTRKQLELLLLNSAEGVSSKLPKTYGSCKRKWKPSLQTIVEVDN